VTLTVTDGNNNMSTTTAIVTVVDDTLPEVITQDITVSLDATGNITITPEDINNGSTDACGIASLTLDTTTFTCDDIGENTVLLTVTDSNDNVATAMATVTVESTIPPEAIAQNITITLDASGNASITPGDIDNGSNAVCGTVTTSIDSMNFNCANVGPNMVTLTVTDSSNNIAIATAIVTVVDDTLPEVITQDITVTLDASGNITITPEDINNGSNDICGITTITLDTATFNCDDLGENTVLLTVTDSNDNVATAMATVTVESTIPPEAIAQDITITLNASGNASITPEDIDNGSNSTCGTIILTADIVDFNCADVGANTVTLTATDSSNNMSTTTAIVMVVDDILPEVITQDITVILGATGNVTITPEDIDNGSNDPCGIVSLELDILNFDTDDIGENTVQLTATDTNGNVSITNAIVTVVDTLSVDHDELDLGLSVYPNPTKGNLNLKITNFNTGNLTYQLFSIHGQLLLSDTVHNDITRIPMHRLAKGMYILKVTSSTKVVKSFKVIKSE
jgi:ribosome biogenesis SPOUT family RNA methylase Rps3